MALRHYIWNHRITISIVLVVAALAAVWILSGTLPLCAFEFRGVDAAGIDVSPDGELLCATVALKGRRDQPNAVRIYDLKNRSVVTGPNVVVNATTREELVGCAWNADGSILAIARESEQGVELWDRKTWTLARRLPAPGALYLGSVCFDRNDNLFAVTWWPETDSSTTTANRAVLWRNPVTHPSASSEPLLPNACKDPTARVYSVSGAPVESGLRIALSYEETCGTKIFLVTRDADGNVSEELEHEYPDDARASVRLTLDGQHLAVLDSRRQVLEMISFHGKRERATIARAERVITDRPRDEMRMKKLDVSRDGRLVACAFDDRVGVYRVQDGKCMLEIPQLMISVALSPDGKYLVTCHPFEESPPDEKRICVFEIPGVSK